MDKSAVNQFLAENPRVARTEGQARIEFEKFMACIGGDRSVSAITKADGRAYKDELMQIRKLHLVTLIKHLSSLSSVFRWCERQGYIAEGSNPVKGLAPAKKQAKKLAAPRRPFTTEELVKVFGSSAFKSQKDAHPERYWLTLLCLFTVARREECGQLALADIGTEDGIPFLRITDTGEGQGLKNEGSKRRIPIHSALIRLGFLDYIERIRKAGHARLFPQLKKGANGYSDSVGKWFSRMVTKCGITDPACVMHSFRHGGINKLHNAGCPHNIVEILAGHSAATVHDRVYAHRELIKLATLRDGLEKLTHSDVEKALLG